MSQQNNTNNFEIIDDNNFAHTVSGCSTLSNAVSDQMESPTTDKIDGFLASSQASSQLGSTSQTSDGFLASSQAFDELLSSSSALSQMGSTSLTSDGFVSTSKITSTCGIKSSVKLPSVFNMLTDDDIEDDDNYNVNDEDVKSELPIESMIITVRGGQSYDSLFTTYKQHSPTGRAAVHVIDYSLLPQITCMLNNDLTNATPLVQLIHDTMAKISHQNIMFNFECCSGCSHQKHHFETHQYKFPKYQVMELMSKLKELSIMVACGDFSLKALITDWNSDILGECPFVNAGEVDGEITLMFDVDSVTNCTSKQLSRFAELSTDGQAHVGTMPGTIVYNVKQNLTDMPYEINVLTVVQNTYKNYTACTETTVGKFKGTAGHVMLTYPDTNWRLLVSNCHFIELVRIDTTLDKFRQVSQKTYGKTMADNIYRGISSLPLEQQACALQREVSRVVSSTQPT